MTREMFQKATDLIPELVAKIKAYEEDGESDIWIQHVKLYTQNDSLFTQDKHVLTDVDVLNHLRKAERFSDDEAIGEIYDDHITVRRFLKDGCYYVVDYYPYNSENAWQNIGQIVKKLGIAV